MPTRVDEPCPRCATPTAPTDEAVAWRTEYGDVPWRQWRYECRCGWTWANAAQRAHNAREYAELRRFLSQRGWA